MTKSCIITSLPPLYSGISLYSLGLISGLEKNFDAKQPIVVITNKTAAKVYSARMRILPVWTRGLKYPFEVFSALLHEKPMVAHFQHEFFLYGGLFSAAIFPLLIFFTRLFGMRVVVTIHGVVPLAQANNQFAEAFFVKSNQTFLKMGLLTLTRIICQLSNIVIVHNSYLREILNRDYRVPTSKIEVIPHGIGERIEKSDKNNDGKKVVLFFGNITPSKGIEVLIKAFEKVNVPNARLIIAGSPHPRGKDYFSKIKTLTQQSAVADKISLTGFVKNELIPSLFEKSSIVVFPYTLAVSSSGGLSLALQYQKPVIVTELPSFEEIITNEQNGLVVPANDSYALSKAIEKLLLDNEFRERIRIQSRQSSEELLWSVIAHKTIECYIK